MTVPAVVRTVRRLVAVTAGTALVLSGCVLGDEGTQRGVRSSSPQRTVDAAAAEPRRSPPASQARPATVPPEDPELRRDLARYCVAHASALDAIEDMVEDIVEELDETSQADAIAVVLGSLEAVTSAVAAELAAGGELHDRVGPLLTAAETTAAGAREALDAVHDAREAYLADQLAGASYLQPLADDPELYATATELAACADLPLGAVAAELHPGDDHHR
jgi:hypothetical protein